MTKNLFFLLILSANTLFAQTHDSLAKRAKEELQTGIELYTKGETDNALAWFEKAVKSAIPAKDYRTAFIGEMVKANTYNDRKTKGALSVAQSALKYARATGDDSNIGGALHILGVSYYNLQQYEKTIEVYKKAMEHHLKAGDSVSYNIVKDSMIAVLPKVGRKKEAVDSIKKASAARNIVYKSDSTRTPDYDRMNIQRSLADFNAADKQSKFETLQEDYLERETEVLRQRMWFISGLSILIITLLLLLYNRQRQKTKAEIKLIKKYIDGLESERERISKELHDGVCNDLLAIEMELRNAGVANDKIALLSQSRQSVRNISHDLLPPQFQHASIDEILTDYIDHLNTPTMNVATHVDRRHEWHKLPHELSFVIYRIVQEAVSNSIKHSRATQVDVRLSRCGTDVEVVISDNGQGFDKGARSRGAGLTTVAERVQSVGGELSIETSEHGTTIKVTFNI